MASFPPRWGQKVSVDVRYLYSRDRIIHIHRGIGRSSLHADDLTKQGMEEGMSQSRNILIFLSKGTMKRPYCQAEQRWAKAYGCNFVGVIEVDNRHNAANILEEKENAPSDLKCILDEVEFIPFRRRDYEEATMVEELLKRGGFFDDQESDA